MALVMSFVIIVLLLLLQAGRQEEKETEGDAKEKIANRRRSFHIYTPIANVSRRSLNVTLPLKGHSDAAPLLSCAVCSQHVIGDARIAGLEKSGVLCRQLQLC